MPSQLSPAEQSRVRVAAIVAAGNATLGEAFLSRVIHEASSLTDDTARVRLAIALTLDHLQIANPMNVSATPWEQLALARQGQHLAPWERLMISMVMREAGEGRDEARSGTRNSGAYTRELSGGETFRALEQMGM